MRPAAAAAIAALVAGVAAAAPAASEPAAAACSAPEARGFDFWIGDWDVVSKSRNSAAPDDPAWYDTGTGRLRVYPAAGGCALVEHFEGAGSAGRIRGFGVRAWDAAAKRWVAVLLWPWGEAPLAAFFTVEGELADGRGDLHLAGDAAAGDGPRYRYTWAEAGADAFHWERSVSADGGLSWRGEWRMEGSRRDPRRERALFAGPRIADGRPLYCAAAEARGFDFLLGEWTGSDTSGTRPRTVTLESYPILDGCAVMEFLAVAGPDGEPAWRQFRVRAYDRTLGRWVQYAVDDTGAPFERLEGEVDADGADLAPPSDGASGGRARESFTPRGDGRAVWERETAAGFGRIWRTALRAELVRR